MLEYLMKKVLSLVIGRVFLNLNSLSDVCELVAYNLPEESALYKGTLDDFVLVIDDFLESANLDSIILVGNSIGGAVAMKYCASKHDANVRGLILLSTSVFGATEGDHRKYREMAENGL
jgi:pimeloyl-ACP methyl ester carboxylesterase